jgi:hypothetical protein
MFEPLEDLATRISATGYFIDPVMTQVVFLAAKLQKPLILEGPASSLAMDAQDYVSSEEMRRALRQLYRSDTETNLKSFLLESLAGELKLIDEKGHWRAPHCSVTTCIRSHGYGLMSCE